MKLLKHAIIVFAASLLLPSCGGDVESARLASESRASEKIAQALYNSAIAAEKAGKLGRAIKIYEKIVLRHPLCPAASESAFRWGKLLEEEGDLLEAFEAYDAILTKYPASPHYAEAMKRQEMIATQATEGQIKDSFIGFKMRFSLKECVAMLAKVRQNAPRAPSAAKAQYAIGRVYQSRGDQASHVVLAITAFRELTRDFPDSKFAPDAQYQIGEILFAQSKDGDQDSANLDRAKRAFEDVVIRYPTSKQAKWQRPKLQALLPTISSGLSKSQSSTEKKGSFHPLLSTTVTLSCAQIPDRCAQAHKVGSTNSPPSNSCYASSFWLSALAS